MGIFETFSKRQKRLLSQGEPDPYHYDSFPETLRVQVINLLSEIFGNCFTRPDAFGEVHQNEKAAGYWSFLHQTLAHEYGVFQLAPGEDPQKRCRAFFLRATKTEDCLDFVELGFQLIWKMAVSYSTQHGAYANEQEECEKVIQELNYRLREHSLGYQFEEGQLIRVDSQFIHAEVVKPALALLYEANFTGASEEFLQAHEHYRAKRYPEAIAGALKAFESTMKGICDERKWPYLESATAKKLIEVIFSKGLIPSSLESHFTGLRSVLESGLPTVRNKQGGHGQGKDSVPIPSYLSAYALHLAASNIVMLLEAHKALK